MAADDYLANEEAAGGGQVDGGAPPDDAAPLAERPAGAGPGNGGGLTFGSDYYYVSFLGAPSVTSPWTLQFGGHHLAINATVVGSDVTLAPSLTGGQPVRFTANGEEIYIVEEEVAEATALLNSLTVEQQSQAVLGTQSIDLVLGPGKDGLTLEQEGLPASQMTGDQNGLFLNLIEARLGILNADDLAPKMAEIEANLQQTYFAWFGSTTDTGSAYWRVTGPTVLIEFSPQNMGGIPAITFTTCTATRVMTTVPHGLSISKRLQAMNKPVLIVLAAIACPVHALAHPVDELVNVAYLFLQPGEIVLELDLTPGAQVAGTILSVLDADGDRAISDTEASNYAQVVLEQTSLTIDSAIGRWTLSEVAVPSLESLEFGHGTIRIVASANRPEEAGEHALSFENLYRPVPNQWTANVFLRPNEGWSYDLLTQQRSQKAQQLAVTFEVSKQ